MKFDEYLNLLEKRFKKFSTFSQHVKQVFEQRTEQFVDINGDPQRAAVLFALLISKNTWEREDISFNLSSDVHILLVKRSSKLFSNPGDMAFPGGKVDEEDENLISTAYREALEEVGIKDTSLHFISCMDEFVSTQGIVVRPVISWCVVDNNDEELGSWAIREFSPKTIEATRTTVIPITHFLDLDNYYCVEFFRDLSKGNSKGFIRYFNIDPYIKDHHVWGLTATMIKRFLDNVFIDNLLPNEIS